MTTGGFLDNLQPSHGLYPKRVIIGFICSLVVVLLFTFIQTISDLAPQSIKNGPIPGLFGAPVALLAIAWFTVIPIWFVVSFATGLIGGKKPIVGSWILGAFAGFALAMVVINFLPGPL